MGIKVNNSNTPESNISRTKLIKALKDQKVALKETSLQIKALTLQKEELLKQTDLEHISEHIEEINNMLEAMEDKLNSLREELEEMLDQEDDDSEEENEEEDKSLDLESPEYIIKSKGLNLKYNGGILTTNFTLGITPEKELDEDKSKATGRKARTLEDYAPTEYELQEINRLSNVDLTAPELYVFTLRSADTIVDRGYEKFHVDALKNMAEMSIDKPVLMDHDHKTKNQVGKVFSASVVNNQLRQKAYFLHIDENYGVIKNIAAGIYNKVSVGFGIALQDFMCNSCGNPMVSKQCMHRPGDMDEKGNTVTATIKAVKDFYEVSLVAVPMQPAAGIRRSLDEEDIQAKSYTRWLELEKQAKYTTENISGVVENSPKLEITNEIDTISNEKSLIEGVSIVSEEKQEQQEEVVAVTEQATAPEASAEVTTPEAKEAEPEMDLVSVIAKLNKTCKLIKKELKKNREARKEQAEEMAKWAEIQKAQTETIAKASNLSMEEVTRSVLSSLPEKAAENTRFGASVMQRFVGKEDQS